MLFRSYYGQSSSLAFTLSEKNFEDEKKNWLKYTNTTPWLPILVSILEGTQNMIHVQIPYLHCNEILSAKRDINAR